MRRGSRFRPRLDAPIFGGRGWGEGGEEQRRTPPPHGLQVMFPAEPLFCMTHAGTGLFKDHG